MEEKNSTVFTSNLFWHSKAALFTRDPGPTLIMDQCVNVSSIPRTQPSSTNLDRQATRLAPHQVSFFATYTHKEEGGP
jgi:hypothetical protein